MRFPRTIFLNTAEDCQWLRDTHLKSIDVPPFGSFILSGSEDSPVALHLFKNKQPPYNEFAQSALSRVDDVLVLEPPVTRKKHVRQEATAVVEAVPEIPVDKGPMVYRESSGQGAAP